MRRLALIAGSGLTVALAGAAALRHADPAPSRPDREWPVAPPGMVAVPGGTTHIGSKDGPPDERPLLTVAVGPFFMDVHPVTVAQFRKFVTATGYATSAERLGDAGVLDRSSGAWTLVAGATWHHPLGPEGPAAPDDHPVTQVSWYDATAYAEWAGKRLPTEFEWEHAARGAVDAREAHPWGAAPAHDPSGFHRANIWQGQFPTVNTGADGHLLTSPVGAFGVNTLGLADLAGNVWEWTDSWYRSYAETASPPTPDATSERVQRGGSFLCHPSYCRGYRVSARSHSSPETALFHVGFRLVSDRIP